MSEALGKIDHQLFDRFIQPRCGYERPEVKVKPRFGVDVSLVDLPGGTTMALTSDPLSLIPSLGLEESAWLSVHLMANDMATTGVAPMYGQFVLNLPATFSKEDFKRYWDYIHRFCRQIGTSITGGHTGFVEHQNSTIAGGGTFISVAPTGQMLVSSGAQVGDAVLVTKQCAISSASILALSFPETVIKELGREVYNKACGLFYQTSSLPDALIASDPSNGYSGVTAMHDVTEGGVLGAVYELCCASGNGAVIYNDALPVGSVQKEICSLFRIDPRYCVGAGAMIITCKKDSAELIINRLKKADISCYQVGEIKEKNKGIKLIENGAETDLIYYEEDPYWAAFFNAYNKGWK